MFFPRLAPLAIAAGIGWGMAFPARADVSFRTDVMSVLSKAGCNAGACHGNASGKGGFKLSLRGEDPEADFAALTRDAYGRRIDANDPDGSLILLKATTRLAHEGGLRFDRTSVEYDLLRQWVAAGARGVTPGEPSLVRLNVNPSDAIVFEPGKSLRLEVRGTFSDGSERDLSRLAVYDPTSTTATVTRDGLVEATASGEVTVLVRYLREQVPVRVAFVPANPDFTWPDLEPRTVVDEHVFRKLKALRLTPSGLVDDDLFLRRACLDLLGVLPSADEARSFAQDTRPDKRARCLDDLLERQAFAECWALKWCDLLRVEEKALDRKGVELFYRWIRDSIATHKPMDRFARELITARGSTYENPPANFYRSHRELNVRAEAVAQVFLGTRLLCAQCHNHPFDHWTQSDYHDWSGLFARVQFKVLENRYPDGLDKHAFTGEQVVFASHDGEARNPRTGRDAPPRFLGAATPLDAGEDRLDALARWTTAPDNPRFARAQVNRIWYHLMGRGLVDPVDDFRATNPATHPELLDALALQFVQSGFDLRATLRTIANSHTYQTSSRPEPSAENDEVNYSHTVVRRLGAEQTLDALAQVAGVPLSFNGYPEGLRAGQIPGVQAVAVRRRGAGTGERFLRVFGKPERLLASEEERSCQTTLGQAFQLITGPVITDLLAHEGNRLDHLLATGEPDAAMVEELYWTALTRPPTGEERSAMLQYLSGSKERRAALEDITWALLNAKEFVLRQ